MADLAAHAQQKATAQRTPGVEFLWLLLAPLGPIGYVLQHFGVRWVLRELVHHADWLLWSGVAVLVPTLFFAAVDYGKAIKRDYKPPSLRVRVARSIAYGLGIGLASVLGFLWWKPELVYRLAELRWNALWLLVWAAPFAWATFALCLSPHKFVAAELPTFRDGAHALAETNDFLLGVTGSNWKTGEGDQKWFYLPEKALFANLYCLGGIGSGKTSAVAKPLFEQAVFKWPKDPNRQIGIYLYDAKGNNAPYVLERARAAGREKDVIVLRPGGEWTMNLVGEGSPTALANKLVYALVAMTDQEPNSYYLKMQLEFATHTFSILSEVLGVGNFSLMQVYDFMTDEKYQAKMLDSAKPKNSISYRWFKNQWEKEDPREKLMLTKGFRADLAPFVSDDIAPTFCATKGNFPGWNSIIDDGKIVVFSMSLDEWGKLGRAMGIFCLMDVQNRLLARTTAAFRASGGNTDRLVMVFADEVWAVMNPGLAEFTAVSREARCCTLALHQGLDQVPERYRATMLGNFRTQVLLGVNDPLTLDTFSKLFGSHRVLRASKSESSGFSGVETQLLSDIKKGRVGGESLSVSVSHSETDESRFTLDDILRLKPFTAVVQMFDGAETQAPTVVKLLKAHEPQNLLG